MAKKPGLKMSDSLAAPVPTPQQKFVAGAPATDAKSERGKMIRVNFEIAPDMHQRLKIHATIKGMTIRDLLLKLIDKEISS